MTNHQQEILNKVIKLKEDILNHVSTKKLTIPNDFIETVQNDTNTLELLKRITHSVSASTGLDIAETLGQHYGFGYWHNIRFWDTQVKENIQTILVAKIQAVKASAKMDDFFFFEDSKLSKEIREEVMALHKNIGECAIKYTFAEDDSEKPALQAKAFSTVLQLCDIPLAFPSGDNVTVRNLISLSRLESISKKESEPSSMSALKEVARNWYQNSGRDFLEQRTGYHYDTYVQYYLYILTSEQLENVQNQFLEDVEKKSDELKADKWDLEALSTSKFLVERVNRILSWKVEV